MASLEETITEADATVAHKKQELAELKVLYDGAMAKVRRLFAQQMPDFKARSVAAVQQKAAAWRGERRAAVEKAKLMSVYMTEIEEEMETALDEGEAAWQRLRELRAAQDNEEARAAQEEVRAAQQEVQVLRARMQQVELSHASAKAHVEAHEAALDAEVANADAASAEAARVRLERAATRVLITSDAERVWAGAPRAPSAGRVFKLSGKSAAEVCAMSSEVSQDVTSADQRAVLARRDDERMQEAPPTVVACGVPVEMAASTVPVDVVSGVLV